MEMRGVLFIKEKKWFISYENKEISVLNDDEELSIIDNNRRVCFEIIEDEAKITHKFPKEHGLDWLIDSSEYPSDY